MGILNWNWDWLCFCYLTMTLIHLQKEHVLFQRDVSTIAKQGQTKLANTTNLRWHRCFIIYWDWDSTPVPFKRFTSRSPKLTQNRKTDFVPGSNTKKNLVCPDEDLLKGTLQFPVLLRRGETDYVGIYRYRLHTATEVVHTLFPPVEEQVLV